jgi:sodium/hydrogen exchanger-like protein 3
MFVTTTIAVVFWTSFVQGITIKPLVQMMGVKTMEEKNPTMNERIGVRFMDHAVSAIVGVIGEFDGQRQRNMYRNFDDKYIKPWILRDPALKDPKIIETFQKRIQDDAMTFMNKNPTEITKFEYSLETKQRLPSLEGKKSTDSVSIDITSKPRSSKDYTDSEMHDILSESMVQPQRRRRMSSTRLSVNESEQAARRMSTKKSMDSSDNLPVVVEEKDFDQHDTKEGYDNAAFDHETEDLKEEDKVLKDLDKVIDNVPLSSIE